MHILSYANSSVNGETQGSENPLLRTLLRTQQVLRTFGFFFPLCVACSGSLDKTKKPLRTRISTPRQNSAMYLQAPLAVQLLFMVFVSVVFILDVYFNVEVIRPQPFVCKPRLLRKPTAVLNSNILCDIVL